MTPTSSDFATFPLQSIFQQNSQNIGALFQPAAVFLFCRKIKLQTFSRRADSPTQFYFIISQARSTAACTDHDLLLNPPN
jgi:hypothetical protein